MRIRRTQSRLGTRNSWSLQADCRTSYEIVPSRKPLTLKALIAEVEHFSMSERLALHAGASLPGDQGRAIVEKLHQYTGLTTADSRRPTCASTVENLGRTWYLNAEPHDPRVVWQPRRFLDKS